MLKIKKSPSQLTTKTRPISASLKSKKSKKKLASSKSKLSRSKSNTLKEKKDEIVAPEKGTEPASSKTLSHYAVISSGKLSNKTLRTRNSEAGKFVEFVADEKSRIYRRHVVNAIKQGKVFTIDQGPNPIRVALQKRGWVEKSGLLYYGKPMNVLRGEYSTTSASLNSDALWAHHKLRHVAPTFIWTQQNRNAMSWGMLQDHQIINMHPKASFTTKVGLAISLRNSHWVSEAGVAYTLYPRCYRLLDKEQRRVFVSDYHLTSTVGLLQFVVGTIEQQGPTALLDPRGKVPLNCIDFAIRHVKRYVKTRMHDDLDHPIETYSASNQWDDFLVHYYSVVLYKEKMFVAPQDKSAPTRLYNSSKNALTAVAPFWRTLPVDGTNNVWICKPGAKSRGKGIVLKNKLDSLAQLMARSTTGMTEDWVVQKYIERPLLIYGTKFDIRQWFIVASWNPLTVWNYRECYLRFCSNPFTIDEFHESIHLCNFAVQHRYKNSKFQDPALPDNNMWDSYTFQAYLKSIGKMDLWKASIYPSMKQSILGVLLSSQEDNEARKNCFELYGADFLLSEDFTPWLLEINSGPSLARSTTVTARMVQQCLEDCIKVIIDHQQNKDANTGMFECIPKRSRLPDPPEKIIDKLSIQGQRLQLNTRRSKRFLPLNKIELKPIKSIDGSVSRLSISSAPTLQTTHANSERSTASTPSIAPSKSKRTGKKTRPSKRDILSKGTPKHDAQSADENQVANAVNPNHTGHQDDFGKGQAQRVPINEEELLEDHANTKHKKPSGSHEFALEGTDVPNSNGEHQNIEKMVAPVEMKLDQQNLSKTTAESNKIIISVNSAAGITNLAPSSSVSIRRRRASKKPEDFAVAAATENAPDVGLGAQQRTMETSLDGQREQKPILNVVTIRDRKPELPNENSQLDISVTASPMQTLSKRERTIRRLQKISSNGMFMQSNLAKNSTGYMTMNS